MPRRRRRVWPLPRATPGSRRRRRPPLRTDRADGAFTQVASVLSDLVERHGVSAHEWSVRRAVLASLPAWARERAVVDDIGNIMVEAGPQGDGDRLHGAHGRSRLRDRVDRSRRHGDARAQGGAVASAWEGPDGARPLRPAGRAQHRHGAGQRHRPALEGAVRLSLRRRRRCVACSAFDATAPRKNPVRCRRGSVSTPKAWRRVASWSACR